MATRNNYLQGAATRGSYSPAVYTPIAYNAVGMDAPIQEDFNTLANSLRQIEDRKEKTEALTSTISSELGKLNLNPSEDAWKFNYINDIRNQINEAIQFGDYSRALSKARSLASEAFNNPALQGRVRAQENYQKFVNTINSRNDLTEADKAWALSKNPYTYKDITDNNGNIVGGSDWQPKISPVGEIDWNRIFVTAKSLVQQKVGHNTSFMFEDVNGKPTTDIRKARNLMYKTTTGWQGIDKKDLSDLVEAAIDNTPGARDRIDQEWEVLNWQDKEGRIDSSNRELYADNERKYSKEEWYNNRFNKPLDAMSGMNYTRDVDIDNNYFALKAATATQSQLPSTGNDYYELVRGKGTPIEDTNDTFNLAAGKVNDSITEIEKIGPALKNNPVWVKAKNDGDFKKLADIVSKTRFITTDERRDRLNHFVNTLRNNANIVSQVVKNGGDTQAYIFNSAFTTGGELPANNKYTKAFMKDYNAFTKGAETLQYSFDDDTDLQNFAQSLGLNLEGNDAGLVSNIDGKPVINLDVSDTRNYRAMSIYNPESISLIDKDNNVLKNNYRGGNPHLSVNFPFNIVSLGSIGTNLYNYYFNGQRRSEEYSPSDFSTPFRKVNYPNLRGVPYNTNNITKKSLNSQSSGAAPTTYTAKTGMLPQIDEAKIKLGLGLIDRTGYEEAVKDANRRWLNLIKKDNGSQYKMAVLDENGNVLRFVGAAERLRYMNAIQSRLNTESNAEDLIGTYTYANDIGIHVRIPESYNKTKGSYVSSEVPASEVVIFGVDDPLINSMREGTNFRGERSYNNLRKFKDVNYTFNDGTKVKWDKSTKQMPVFTDANGHSYAVTDEFLKNRFSAEEGYNDVRNAMIEAISKTAPNSNKQVYMNNLLNNSAIAANLYNHWMAEYYPEITDTDAKMNYFISLLEKVTNETKDIK